MKHSWQLQHAKNRFSEVVDKAISQGPQEVTRHGKQAVFVVSAGDYRRNRPPATDLLSFFRESPLADLDIQRDRGRARKIDL